MKKFNALTLIEVLLVLAVIALIMLGTVSQIQRYQSSRNIQEAKATVQALSSYAVSLYLANCQSMFSGNTNYTCVGGQASQSNTYCKKLPVIANPFYKQATNYVIEVTLFNNGTMLNSPQLVIALPFTSPGTSFGSSASAQLKAQLSKYIAALQPTLIAASAHNGGIFPGAGYYLPNYAAVSNTRYSVSASSDPCLKNTGASICLEWVVTPNNWGSLSTGSTNNQADAAQLNATIAQYVPTQTTYNSMQKQKTGDKTQAECTAIILNHGQSR